MEKINIDVIEIIQKKNKFYVGKMKVRDLLRIATIHMRNPKDGNSERYLNEVKEKLDNMINIADSDQGIQRVIQMRRLKEISEYIVSADGLIPGSIVISLNNKCNCDGDEEIYLHNNGYILEYENDRVVSLIINPEKVNAFIVDGQHRLASFLNAKEYIDQFDLVVTIFLDLELSIQAELFGKINGTQKPVNKSLLYDLSEFNKTELDDIARCHAIAKWFNQNDQSPFFNKISMLGFGAGTLSQSAFIDELLRYIKERKTSSKKVYKSILRNKDDKEIITILYTYFQSIKELFEFAWNDSTNYIINRTTGFGALMKLFYYIYIFIYANEKKFEKKEIKILFEKVDEKYFSVQENGKGGSQGVQKQLSDKLRNLIFGVDFDYESLEQAYTKKCNLCLIKKNK